MSADPAVSAWQCIMAPRGRGEDGPLSGWWHRLVMEHYSAAEAAWLAAAEAASCGYATELAEYAAEHPRPTLRATLVGLSSGAYAVEAGAHHA